MTKLLGVSGTKLKTECLVSNRQPELTKWGISGTLARIYNLSVPFLPLHCKKSFLIEGLASLNKLEELHYMMGLKQNGEMGKQSSLKCLNQKNTSTPSQVH